MSGAATNKPTAPDLREKIAAIVGRLGTFAWNAQCEGLESDNVTKSETEAVDDILALLPDPIPQGEDGFLDELEADLAEVMRGRPPHADLLKLKRGVDRLIAIARASEANDFQIAEQLHHMQHGPSAWATLTDLGRAEYTKRLARAREAVSIARAAGGKQ